MTEPTLGLLRILLLDALKIMESQSEREGEIPLYPCSAVEALLARAHAVRFLEPVELCGGAIRATFFPAGHVLGASAIGLETAEGNVLVTGDVSLTDQLTVSGMMRPRFSPDIVVCESTYGARLHASRRAEEERLGQRISEVVAEGGKVLIPAFALGRAQEVLLILRKALAPQRADAPVAPVYVDGLVRAICKSYCQYADYLSPPLRERSAAGRELFYTGDGRISPVQTPQQRETILSGGPCVIVASSGMLTGGASTFYAAALAADERALIALTGYQDEESPGRQLQQLATGQAPSKEILLNGKTVQAQCRIETYGLSAHADAQELAGLIKALGPKDIVLVHGDGLSRQGLARVLFDNGCSQVHLPRLGDCLELVAAPQRPTKKALQGMGGQRPFTSESLPELHQFLWAHEPPGKTYALHDLAALWYGTDAVPLDLCSIDDVLRSKQPFFLPDTRRPFLYRCLDPDAQRAAACPVPSLKDEAGRVEQNLALTLVDQKLGVDSGLYKRGAERQDWTLRLFFRFPDTAQKTYAAELSALKEETGWNIVVHPEAHQASLERCASEGLRPEAQLLRFSIFKEQKRAEATVDNLPEEEAWQQERCLRFEEMTGFSLQLKKASATTHASKTVYDDSGRMEINRALAEIDRAFAHAPHQPYKKSKKNDAQGELIELAFISPEIGAQYQELIDELSYRLSWRIQVAPKVDQQRVLQLLHTRLPASWRLSKGPGLDVAGRRVKLKLAEAPPEKELGEVSAELLQLTGFSLEVVF
jgi:Cft2 family RNA processing exonuclease